MRNFVMTQDIAADTS